MILPTDPTTIPSPSSTRISDQSSNNNNNNNFNNFLKLLTTELKYQDPMKPLDPTQTVTQLATFSGVEQTIKTNALLSKLIEVSSKTHESLLIGKTLSSADGNKLGVVSSITLFNSIPTAIMDTGKRIVITPDLLVG